MVLTLPVCCCALINGESFIHVDVVSLFATRVAAAFSFEWNKEVFNFMT